MKTYHFPLFGLVVVALAAAVAILTGAAVVSGAAVPGAVAPEANTEVGGLDDEARAPGQSAPTTNVGERIAAEADEMVANCRYGATSHIDSGLQRWLDDLGAGWWLDFNVNYATPAENGAEYAHVIWVEQKKDGAGNYLNDYDVVPDMESDSLGYLIQRRPGRMWIVGNEVDRGPDPGQIEGGQGDTKPAMYAQIYHEVYNYIKAWDPTALVTPSALVEVTPGRMQYLDKVYDAYLASYGQPMPVDLWNMHLYILAEMRPDGIPSFYAGLALDTDPAIAKYESTGDPAECGDPNDDVYCVAEHDDMDIFVNQVVRMRTWMKDHGYQQTPLIITEYSLNLPYEIRPQPEGCWVKDEFGNCFTPERVRDFAEATFNYLETAVDPALGYAHDNDRLVQQWMWYSLYLPGRFSTSNLAADDVDPLNLTPAGQVFYDATRAEPAHVNLLPAELNSSTGSLDAGGEVSAKVTVAVRNNGNTRVDAPFTVTVYRDAALTQVIGTATIPAPDEDFVGMTGCAVRPLWAEAKVTWQEPSGPGDYPYWVKVDSSEEIEESDETDNVTSGTISVVPAAVSVLKSADDNLVPESGKNVNFTFQVTNESDGSVTISELSDSVFGPLAGDGDCQIGTVLAVGNACEFSLTRRITGDASGDPHYNEFTAAVVDGSEVTTEDTEGETINFEDSPPVIAVLKRANDNTIPKNGQDVSFTFRVLNQSQETVTITSLTDTVFGPLVGDGDCAIGTQLASGDACRFTLMEWIQEVEEGVPHYNEFTAAVVDNEGTTAEDSEGETIEFADIANDLFLPFIIRAP